MIIAVLVVLLIYVSVRAISYYCCMKGLLFYIMSECNNDISSEKVSELTSMALERSIKELFGLV